MNDSIVKDRFNNVQYVFIGEVIFPLHILDINKHNVHCCVQLHKCDSKPFISNHFLNVLHSV